MDLYLKSDSIYTNTLDTDKFARMLDDPSQCYKFYWLEAIINLIAITDDDLSFDQIINEMICEAWYSVTRYHLHLGPTIKGKSENFLEHAIKTVEADYQLPPSASKQNILAAIKRNDAAIKCDKIGLTAYVPYRLLSSFLDDIGGSDPIWKQHKYFIAYIEKTNISSPLLYTIIDGKGLHKKVRINRYWKQLIMDNYPVVVSWIQLKKARFLQDRNPGVPGIIYKLSQEIENARHLSHARALWKSAAEVFQFPIHDIYSGNPIDIQQSDLDHFVPWSFVANDELWNLIPMEKRLNSSKSNRLPVWNLYFKNMAALQYQLYIAIFKYPGIRTEFEKCRRDNLNAIWATDSLYIEGNSKKQFTEILERNLRPIYDSAYLQGYGLWKCDDSCLR